jgi:hypothetical protein
MIQFINKRLALLSPRQQQIVALLILALMATVAVVLVAVLVAFTWNGGDFNWADFELMLAFGGSLAVFAAVFGPIIEYGLLRWDTRNEKTAFASARVVAVLCGIAPFFDPWSDRDLSGLGGLVVYANICLWAAAIAVGAHRIRNWMSRLSPYWSDKGLHLMLVLVTAVVIEMVMHKLWAEGVRVSRNPSANPTHSEIAAMWFRLMMPPLVIGGSTWLIFWRRTPIQDEDFDLIVEGKRNDFPMLSWSQERGTEATLASKDAKERFTFWIGLIAFGAIIGLSTGRTENLFLGAVAAAWIGAFGLRGAGSLKMSGQTLQSVPYSPTAADRREEMTPVTQREDCEAFLRDHEGVIYFFIARGDKSKGPLPLVDSVPWDSFGNFEEGSHRQWFRSRGSPSELADWGVIIAQSNIGRVVPVAETVHSHAWLVELLVKLQNTFIAPRDKIMRDFREAEQKRAPEEPKKTDDEPLGNDAPIRPF